MPTAKGDQFAVEFNRRRQRSWIGWEIHNHRIRLRHGMAHGAVYRLKHRVIGRIGNAAYRSAGDDEAELMDGVGRVRHQNRIARA